MAANNKVARAINRAQKTQDRIAALEAELFQKEREADRVLGEAVRQSVGNPRSKWARHTDLTVAEFYALVVDGDTLDYEPDDSGTSVLDDSDGDEQHRQPEVHDSVRGGGAAGVVGGGLGF